MGWICPVSVFLLGALVAAIPIVFAVRFRRQATAIANMRTTPVEDLHSGVAKVKTRVVAQDRLLISPISEKHCVYYHFVVEEMSHSGGTWTSGSGGPRHSPGGTYWETIIDDEQSIDVLLEDETGQVDVRLSDADVDLKSEKSQVTGSFDTPPERLKRMLRSRYGESTRGMLFNRTLRYTESFLEDGAKVVVVGEVVRGRGDIPRLVGGNVPLMVSDKGKKDLGAPYRRRARNCYIGTAFIMVFVLFSTIVTGVIANKFANDKKPEQNAGGPGAQPQQPGGPKQPGPAGQPGPGGGPGPAGPPAPGDPPPKPGAELDPFLADLRSPDVLKRKAAAEQLQGHPVVEARRAEVRRALETLASELDPITAVPALKALAKWGDKETVPLLLRMREPRKATYHNQVYMTLGAIPDEQSATALAASLGDNEENGLASAALRIMGPPAEPAVLRELQKSTDYYTQALACAVLGSIGTRASLPVLEKLAASTDLRVSGLARRAITDINERLAGR